MLFCSYSSKASAQKIALIDMEYILNKNPSYEKVVEQLSQQSKKWKAEIETLQQEYKNMKKNYESELLFFSTEMQFKRKEDMLKKELETQELNRKYWGINGEYYKRRDQLMKPIMDEINKTLEEIAKDKGYHVVFLRSSEIIYFSPQIDISNELLLKLGYVTK